MKNRIGIIIGMILLLTSLVSAEVIRIEPETLPNISMYAGETIIQNITIKTDGNYLVYIDYNVTNNNSDMQGFHVSFESPIQVNKEKTIQIEISTLPNFKPDNFTLNIYASTEKAEEEIITEYNETTEIIEVQELKLKIDSNGTGTITVKKFIENPEKGLGIPDLGKFFEITADQEIIDGMNETLINISYTDAEVSSAGIVESTLRLYFYNESSGEWQVSPNSGVDTVNNYVWAKTTHFSIWGIFGSVPTPTIVAGVGGGGCVYEWNCTEWGECLPDGTQTRTCENIGNCPDSYRTPEATQPCNYTAPPVTPPTPPTPPTAATPGIVGAVVAVGNAIKKVPIAVFIAVIVVAVIIFLIVRKHQKEKRKK